MSAAWVAVIVGVAAVTTSWLIAKRGWKRTDQGAEQQQQAIANLVRLHVTGFGGLRVEITNDGPVPVTNVELVDIGRDGAGPSETWCVNNRVPGAAAHATHIAAHGGTFKVPVDLLDADGKNLRMPADEYMITVRWTDNNGDHWERVSHALPRRVQKT